MAVADPPRLTPTQRTPAVSDPFVHLRVASAYSMRYGASPPEILAERAAEYDMDLLGLTDRDGLYGAVRFVQACRRFRIGPIVGVDLAVAPSTPGGGARRDRVEPRVCVLAQDRQGWAQLCRLISASHLGGERGHPTTTLESIAEAAAHGHLRVLLGADSDLGVAVASGRLDRAEAAIRRWSALVDPGRLVVAVTHQRRGGSGAGSLTHAARMLILADRQAVTAVLTNAVRMADRRLAPTLDVLDASRRLVALDRRHVDQGNAEAYLKSGKEMQLLADEVAQRSGRGERGGRRLLAATRAVALSCVLDPEADLGLGTPHLPELVVAGAQGRMLGQHTTEGRAAAMAVLRERCELGARHRYGELERGAAARRRADRLAEELAVVDHLGFASYFLTVADIVELIAARGIRCAARGSGAGSLINYVLGISHVEPLELGLLMERFLSVHRRTLPDIDLDVESERRTEVYEMILARFGGRRVACVAMLDTYRVRHAVRDVGAALSLPPSEIDAIAKAFPHLRARDARRALRDLPELRSMGLAERRLDLLFDLVESLDGLPRHIALHPCGVLLSDLTLLDRTPVEASFAGFPMSQFDKDDVEELGLLKLDVLGIRMQSAMAHTLAEIRRTEDAVIDLDTLPLRDEPTFELIQRAQTLGCFQIESPGQRELVGKFAPETFNDLVIDISLFRPGPVQSDMIVPFLEARHGWAVRQSLPPRLAPLVAETSGVVVFHEQVIRIIAALTGRRADEAEELRRALGDRERADEVAGWIRVRADQEGFEPAEIEQSMVVLRAFASFGFCKAHAAAFALTTFHSAWLKAHYPAHFLAGVLTHDPGMYPKRLILDEARRFGVGVLRLDVNASQGAYTVEPQTGAREGSGYGIRLSLADVRGINQTEIDRIVTGQPYQSLPDFWSRARVSQPIIERLVLAGAFDALYDLSPDRSTLSTRGRPTTRDLLLAVADLGRADRVDRRVAARGRSRVLKRSSEETDPRDQARAQAARPQQPKAPEIQLPLDIGLTGGLDGDGELVATGLPELSVTERVRSELDILGLDATEHIVGDYLPLLRALGVTFSAELLRRRSRSELLVAGVKVATQTPPVRSGRRVIFLTLDDSTGPVDATFFDNVQGPYAGTVFDCWLLLVRGVLRRTGPRGVSLRATGAWDLAGLLDRWRSALDETGRLEDALAAVRAAIVDPPATDTALAPTRVLVHPSGFRQSPYADVRPPDPVGKLWHTSPGSPGR